MDRIVDFLQVVLTLGAAGAFWANTPGGSILGWLLIGAATMLNVCCENKQRARTIEAGLYLASMILQGSGMILEQVGMTNLAYIPLAVLVLVNGYEIARPALDGLKKVVGK